MRQAVMTAPGQIEIRDVPAPEPGCGEVRLRVRRIGICGSDVHVWHGRHPYTSYPVVQGHEFAGSIESVGPGVTDLAVGGKATALPQIVCGTCPPCRRGDEHICDALKVAGFQADGAAQELFVTDAAKVVPLPEALTFEQGALVEPTAVALHAAGRAGETAGRAVVVLGAGPIGNLTAQAARAAGADVLITDLSDDRLDVARRCGIEHVSNAAREGLDVAVRRAFGGRGFDVAFECVGVAATLSAAVEHVNKGGTIIVVGVFPAPVPVDVGAIQDRELNLRGTLMYWTQDYRDAVAAIADGRIATDPLMGRHFDLADYGRAYRYIDQMSAKTMKVFIDV